MADQELFELETRMKKELKGYDVCCCRDEGCVEQSYGVCPLHFPRTPEEIRRLVKAFAEEAYERGYDEAIEKCKTI